MEGKISFKKLDKIAVIFKLAWKIRTEVNSFIFTFFTIFMAKLKGVNIIHSCKFYGYTYFYRASGTQIIIGENVVFRSDKISNLIGINKRCIISTLNRNAKIIIGDGSGFSGVTIASANQICIGKKVMVGANTLITDTNWHNIKPTERHLSDPKPGKIIIEDNVFIGYGCIILKNVTIGSNSVIGAGSVVVNDIPPNVIASGNPCKVIKTF